MWTPAVLKHRHLRLHFSSISICFSYSYVWAGLQAKLASSLVNFWAHDKKWLSDWLIHWFTANEQMSTQQAANFACNMCQKLSALGKNGQSYSENKKVDFLSVLRKKYPKESCRLVQRNRLQWRSRSDQPIAWNNVVVNISVSQLNALNCRLKNGFQSSAKFSFLPLHCVPKAKWSSCQHCLFSQKFNLPTTMPYMEINVIHMSRYVC